MKKQLEQKLYKKYPSIFVQRTLPMSESAMGWGCQCGDSWFSIIDDLCEKVMKVAPTIQFTTVKEKYGTLRVYTNLDGRDKVEQLLSDAEKKSAITCEQCGKPGKTVQIHGWYSTVCLMHEKQLEKKWKGFDTDPLIPAGDRQKVKKNLI